MSTYESTVLQPILGNPILARCNYGSLARLLPHVRQQRVNPGETIFREGDHADYLYLLLEGEVRLEAPETSRAAQAKTVIVSSGHFGEESGTEIPSYTTNAVAATGATLLAIPRDKLAPVLSANRGVRSELYFSLMHRFGGAPAARKESRAAAQAPARDAGWLPVAGWLCTIAAPALVLAFGDRLGLEQSAVVFLAVLTATITMWVFGLTDEYVPALFALLATLVLGLAPAPTVLSGFASDGFFMAMSILGLGALIVASGLSYRLLLLLLHYLPNRRAWHHAGLVLAGVLLTPVVPSMNARIALVGPFMTDMADILRLRPRSPAITAMAMAAFSGATLLSPVFLTSKSVNFVVLGLLSEQAQQDFTWLAWLVAAAIYGAVVMAAYFGLALLLFRQDAVSPLAKGQVAAQLKLMGPLKNREIAAILGVLLFIAGVITSSIHRVQASWLGLAILYGLLLFGFLRKNEFKEKIDWPLLVYLGGLVGIIAAFNYLGLDKWVAGYLTPLGAYIRGDFRLFVLLLLGIVLAIRLVVPISATIVICATTLMPLGELYGVHPWTIGFIILVFGELWFLPYQCSYYNQFRNVTGGVNGYDERTFLLGNALINALKIGAVFVSLPYWAGEGLL